MTYPAVLTRPPRLRGVVERPRLATAAGDVPLVVLAGPTGTGKTVAAAQLAAGTRVAWIRLAPGYAGVGDLPGLTAAALGQDRPAAGDADLFAVASALLEVLEAEPTTLVVDDLHEGEGTIEVALAELVPLVPPDSRVVVTTRTRPSGLIGRVAPSDVVVLDAQDLAFDLDEAGSLLGDAAASALERTGGWAIGLAAMAETGADGDPLEDLARRVLDDLDGDLRAAALALTALPYLTAELAAGLGLGGGALLDRLTAATTLVEEHGDVVQLSPAAREALAGSLDPAEADTLRRRAAPRLAATDPTAAIDLHVAVDDPDGAADVLAAHLSTIGVERAVHWLYRLPAELRHRFPPVLAAGRATVNLELAVAEAQRRLDEAASPDARREALLALGSVLANRGELEPAARALEEARGLARGTAAAVPAWELARVRWLSGDLRGARAALAEAGDGVWAAWLDGQLALAAEDPHGARLAADRAAEVAARDGTSPVPGLALAATVALLAGDDPAVDAARALELAREAGGRELVAAAPVAGWAAVRAGRLDDAVAAIEDLERKVARQDHEARVHAAVLRAAVSARGEDSERRERDARRVRDLRQAGYAPLTALAERVLGTDGLTRAGSVSVDVLGDLTVHVAGRSSQAADWRSRKALEVLVLLARAGERGMRRDDVIVSVWPGKEPSSGRTLLRTALSEIRRRLEPDRAAGEPSRYVSTPGDRVVVAVPTDLGRAEAALAAGDAATAFRLLAPGPADDLPDALWADDLRTEVARLRLDAATRAADLEDREVARAALEVLVVDEPWMKEHVDRLVALHREVGDEAAALTVERRWFEDD